MLRALLARALEPVDLALRPPRAPRRAGRASAMRVAVLLDDVLAVAALTELLADRLELLAQQELALRASPCRRRPRCGSCSATSSSASASRAHATTFSSRASTSIVSSSSTLRSIGEVGPPAGGVGERAGVGRRPAAPRSGGRPPRCSAMTATAARYSRAELPGPVGRLDRRRRARPRPRAPRRCRPRRRPRRPGAGRARPARATPLGSSPGVLDVGDGARPGRSARRSGGRAAAAGRRRRSPPRPRPRPSASSVSRARVTTIWGSTTPVVRASRGRIAWSGPPGFTGVAVSGVSGVGHASSLGLGPLAHPGRGLITPLREVRTLPGGPLFPGDRVDFGAGSQGPGGPRTGRAGAYEGPVIFSGRTSSSNSSPVRWPSCTAASLSVSLFLCAFLAMAAALS